MKIVTWAINRKNLPKYRANFVRVGISKYSLNFGDLRCLIKYFEGDLPWYLHTVQIVLMFYKKKHCKCNFCFQSHKPV